MPRFLIEVPHEDSIVVCLRAVDVFLRSGSHFLTHADWGCKDGNHKAWLVVDVESRDEAANIIPPMFRAQAKIVQLNAFTLAEIEGMMQRHEQQM
jgi:hypothetical protein